MKMLKNENQCVLADGVGQLLGAYLTDDVFMQFPLVIVGKNELLRITSEHGEPSGKPTYIALEQEEAGKCKFKVFPATDRDCEITIRYYPHMKEG